MRPPLMQRGQRLSKHASGGTEAGGVRVHSFEGPRIDRRPERWRRRLIRMSRWMHGVGGAAAVGLLLAAASSLAAEEEGIPWGRGFEKALHHARETGKPMLIDFWAEWCGWCHRLDQTTYRDPAAVRLSEKFVSIKVDTEGSREDVEVAIRYNVSSLPTIAFLSPSGRPLMRIVGYQGPGQFPKTMRQALEVAEKVMKWEGQIVQDPRHAHALAELGSHLFHQEFYDESRELLERALEYDARRESGERKRSRLLLGVIYSSERSYDQARDVLRAGLKLRPRGTYEPRLLYVLARTELHAGRPCKAMGPLLEIEAEYPESEMLHRAQQMLSYVERKHDCRK